MSLHTDTLTNQLFCGIPIHILTHVVLALIFYILLLVSNRIGVMISVLTSGAVDHGFGRVKPKTI
jgi:hypothetical protein